MSDMDVKAMIANRATTVVAVGPPRPTGKPNSGNVGNVTSPAAVRRERLAASVRRRRRELMARRDAKVKAERSEAGRDES